jgi:hypothetical protein
MLLSANQKRNYVRRTGLVIPKGVAVGKLPLISFPDEIVSAVRVTLNKLARALHYKYAEKIVPLNGHVEVVFMPPHEVPPEFSVDALPLFTNQSLMRRSGKDLSEQFFCRINFSDDRNLGAYLCIFREAVVAVLTVSCIVPFEDIGDGDDIVGGELA